MNISDPTTDPCGMLYASATASEVPAGVLKICVRSERYEWNHAWT